MRWFALVLVVFPVLTCSAQKKPGCSPEIPRYSEWSAAQHFPNVLEAGRQQALASKLSQLTLHMSQAEVSALAGPPTYAADGALQPNAIACVWGYSFEDPGPSSGPAAKHRVTLGFTRDGSLAAIVPQRVDGVQILQLQDKSCAAGSPVSDSVAAETVAAGKTYVADSQRQAKVRAGYAGLSLGMSVDQVEDLLGKADWVSVRPHGHLPNVWFVGVPCQRQLAYILRQNSANPADANTVAVHLSFDENGRLFWAAPQNVEGLKAMGSAVQ